jgi:hypothetical protein
MPESSTPAPTRKVGRPRVYSSGEKRPTLTFRVRGHTYEMLRDAALASNRSLSEEIEHHVERSLQERDFLMTHFGRADTITLIKTIASHLNTTQATTKRSWTEDANTRHAVLAVIYDVMKSQFGALDDLRGLSAAAFHELEAQRAEELVGRVSATAWAAASPPTVHRAESGRECSGRDHASALAPKSTMTSRRLIRSPRREEANPFTSPQPLIRGHGQSAAASDPPEPSSRA